jgi:hypothetical protein
MPAIPEERPLKVCFTCRYWTPKLKGFCEKLKQGTGKFHLCAEWSEAAKAKEDPVLTNTRETAGAQRESRIKA